MLKECRSHGYFREEFCPHCGSEGKFLLNDEEVELLGRTMAGVLRHFPQRYGLEMDAHGWVDLRDFLTAIQIRNRRFRFVRQHHVIGLIETDPKGRYQFEDGKIRATYDGGHPGRLVLSDDGGGEPPPDGGGAEAFGPQDGPPQRDVRGGPRGRPRPHRAAGHLGDRCEGRPGVRRRNPQGREDGVYVEGNPERVPPSIAACRRRIAAGTSDGTPGMIFNRPTK